MNHRSLILLSHLGRAAAVACLAAVPLFAIAAARAAEEQSASLPLKRVVLFTAGVGFFEHDGQVQDNAKVDMKFNARDINDLLMSMVVQDLGGGKVSTVNYGSKDPITKTLKTFAIDLTDNPTMAELLQQVRGEKVEIDAPTKIAGIILGVETRKKQLGERETIDVDVLNLSTSEGLRAVPLDTVSRIKLVNEQLDGELQKALALLASAHAVDKKSVTLNFLGQGKRDVRVGYIQESPVWKTTYRLVLADEKPLLQGWAIVENNSESDWTNVDLTLVSGRPISFQMDLYQPLYVPRPQVELETYASLRPQVYSQDLLARQNELANRARRLAGTTPATQAPSRGPMRGGMGGGMGGGMMGGGMGGMGTVAGKSFAEAPAAAETERLALGFRQGVEAMAQAGNVGSLFRYVINTPVSLPRQQSAMLPIVNAEVKGSKVSIYNARVNAKYPLNGLRFTNSTDLHLMQGPITVFDGGTYAGDAMIEDLPPGSTRLLSYALDLETEVAPESKGKPEQLLSVRLLKGTMIVSRKYSREQSYVVKNSGAKTKSVLVEYPVDADWTLLSPKPNEKTRDLYRFAVEAKPGEPATLAVEEERTDRQQLALSNINDSSIQVYVSAKVVSDKVKAALQEIVKRKHDLEQVAAEKAQLQRRIAEIGEDQARIRQNMAQLDRNSDLYKNYVKKLSEQETEMGSLREKIAALSDRETGMKKALDDYLLGLDLS